ncbi:hypothetical protein H5410_046454 [Solanum commersonii]|uniref:DUF4283 domain-containing protein n=1 Tax=Solanum commersonii TaxID=4109 RepID=A0A9J5XFK2_SOLCO|nr:hypothetical protein H5410_046454 [Solanum commersonii]
MANFSTETRVAGMAHEPPVELRWLPDHHQSERHDDGNKPQSSTPSYTSHSSSKAQDTKAVNTAISERELEGIRKFISHEISGSNLGKVSMTLESTSPELQHSKKSLDSTIPIDSNREAISARIATESTELRATSGRIRADSTTGVYSPHDGVHITEISVQMDSGNAGGESFGEKPNQIVGVHENFGNVNYSPPLEIHLSEPSSNFDGKNTTTNQANRSNDSMKNVNERKSRNMHNTEGSNSLPISPAAINIQLDANHQLGAKTSQEAGNANDQATRIPNSENSSDAAHSSNFSFGIKGDSTNLTPTPITYLMQVAATQDRLAEETGQTGHKDNEEKQDQLKEINQQGGKSRTQDSNDRANMEYHNNFPKISNNFTRYVPNPQRNRDDAAKVNNEVALNNGKQPNAQQQGQDQNTNKPDRIPDPTSFTIVQSFAARLRYNQSKNEIPIVLDAPIHTVRQGLPAVLLEENDYSIKLAEFCKHTLVGKFTNTMPKMELIRRSFTLQTQLTGGGVKISHYNSRHVYIDLDNEFDYVTVWTKQKMSIEGQIMRIQAWTPEFTPEEETPIVPIWVALPELPWHCYNKVLLSTLLESIGKALFLDSPTSQRTRGSMARVRVQVDLIKARPPHIWMGFKNSDPNKGRWQKIQYEGIPDYCMYCKHQGHMDNVCTIKRRDEEFKRRKEMETEKHNKTKSDQGNGTTEIGTRQQGHQHIVQEKDYKEVIDQEEQWQVLKRKQPKNQEQTLSKTAWRLVSPQYKTTKNNMQQAPSTAGILSNIPVHNNYINLVMQEQPNKGIAGYSTNKGQSDHDVQTIEGSRDESGIDLSLPVPHSPIVIYVDAENADEVCGGMDGGCQKKPTNLQEGVTKGGSLTHVLHEVVHTDHRLDSRASVTPIPVQNSQNVQEKVNKNHKGRIDTGQVQR